MNRLLLYALVFCTNALILVFEITGGRLLAPYLGTSVGVWAGLIAVVLTGMAIGYYFGGRYADQDASKKRIAGVLILAGVATLLAWSVRDLIPMLVASLQMRVTLGALIVGIPLFMPATILLAAVSPMVAKNLLLRLDDSAKVVGELSAVGTVGSIVGAVGTGLYLIPTFGVSAILLGVAVSILILASVLFFSAVRAQAGMMFGIAVLAFFLNAVPTFADTLIADVSTPYNRIFVGKISEEGRAVVVSTSPFGWQCGMFIEPDGTVREEELVFTYHTGQAAVINLAFPDGPPRALFLGGCIESFPRYLLRTYPETVGTSVEIDPGMTEVANKYFDFREEDFPNLTLVYEDARTFINRHEQSYDMILLDAWGATGKPSAHLASKEMYEQMSAALTEDGIAIVNVIGTYDNHTSYLVASTLKTARGVFPNVALYAYTDEPSRMQNMVMVLSHSRVFPETIETDEIILRQVEPGTSGIILTDDYAPTDGFTQWKELTAP